MPSDGFNLIVELAIIGAVALAVIGVVAGGGYHLGLQHAESDDSTRNITVYVPEHTHGGEPEPSSVAVDVGGVDCRDGQLDTRTCNAPITVDTSAGGVIIANPHGAAVTAHDGDTHSLPVGEGEQLTLYVVEDGQITPVKQIRLLDDGATVTEAEAGDGPLAEKNDSRTNAGDSSD